MATRFIKQGDVDYSWMWPPKLNKDVIVDRVAQEFGGNPYDRGRKRENVLPRQVSMTMLYLFTPMDVWEIADMFNVDHSTVSHSFDVVRSLCKTYPHIKDQVIKIEAEFEEAV